MPHCLHAQLQGEVASKWKYVRKQAGTTSGKVSTLHNAATYTVSHYHTPGGTWPTLTLYSGLLPTNYLLTYLKVEFEVNLVILFSDGHLLTENFPLKLIRTR